MTTIAGDRQLELVCSTLVDQQLAIDCQLSRPSLSRICLKFILNYLEFIWSLSKVILGYPELSPVSLSVLSASWFQLETDSFEKTLFSLKQLSIESRNFSQNYHMFVWLNEDRRRQYFVSLSSSEFPHWRCLRISKYSS